MCEPAIRQLTDKDWELYKSIRLRSLQDSPDAFSSTFEHESKLSDEEWIERVKVNGRAYQALPLVAELKGNPIGIACGVIHSSGDKSAKVYQMWVDPENRGKGVGRLLLSHVVNWAKKAEMFGLELDVTTSNIEALNLYKSTGFVNFDEIEPLRPGSKLSTQSMVMLFDVN